jgi:hypothetical protein
MGQSDSLAEIEPRSGLPGAYRVEETEAAKHPEIKDLQSEAIANAMMKCLVRYPSATMSRP